MVGCLYFVKIPSGLKMMFEDWEQHLITIKRFIMDQTYRNQDVVKLFNEFLNENIDKGRLRFRVVK